MVRRWVKDALQLPIIITALCAVNNVSSIDPVCYDYLGCFSMSSPWRSIPRPLPPPQSPDNVDTQFYLYTRNHSEGFPVDKLPDISLEGAGFDARKQTFFLTHGFLAHASIGWLDTMADALLTRLDANIFVVNWEKGASKLNYLEVAANTRVVGAEIARLMQHLLMSENATTSRFHLIGHSLGAHIMSYAAKQVPNIARIIALDPAQPGFEGYSQEVRLDKSDALFVEVIHTNAKPFFPLLGTGMVAEVGHVDFYINGGWDQPGCLIPKERPRVNSITDLALFPVEVFANFVKCPHERSIHILTASLLNKDCVFWGSRLSPFSITASILSGGNIPTWLMSLPRCSRDTCSPLGLDTNNYPARGSFLLITTGTDPFCIPDPIIDQTMAPFRREDFYEDDYINTPMYTIK